MKCEVVPSELSKVLKFSSSFYSSQINENVESTFGLISKSGLWLYIVHDTIINIYCTESGKWQGGHCFAESLKNPSAKITAAVEISSSHISFPCVILAIEQDHESLLCMFDVNLCQVVQAVLIPDRVTSLDIVSGNGGVCIETHNLCRRLRYMFGIVAVGTLHGHVFFLDLCLDEDFSCNELLPNITAVVKKKDFSPQKREWAIAKKQHIFLHLNEESTSGSSFEFKSRSSILGRFANGDVSVTAVKYIQSLTTLTVGFNFGGIQLWDLHSLMLQFTISDDQHEQAIVSFAFQEPENDPRNFCYLWVVKGHSVSEEDVPSSISVATLYSLTYFKRDYREGFGVLYYELQTCNKRFELPLTNGALNSTSTIGTRLLSCQVISQKEVPHSLGPAVVHDNSDSVSEDMSVCFLSWEVWPDAQHEPPSYHLAVFDLNQWYQAHMPFNFRCNPSELNSYLGIFSLDEISRQLNEDGIMGLCTIPQSVKKFKALSVSEEFFYPSSLGFQLLCFSENGQCKATYFGFQRHLLFEIAELGPKVLFNPKEIYSSLIKSGLVSDLHGGADRTPLSVQKEAILQLALEYYLPFFFMKCLKEWRSSDSIHEGCTSKSILSWAWKRVITIKNSIDRLSVPLFNCSGTDVDKGSLKYLYSYRRQLTLIDSIIEGYQKYVTPRTEQGIKELQCRKYVISSINTYLHVLLWLRSSRILPEVCEEEALSKSVVYRANRLEETFSVRRSRLQKLHSSLAADDVFLIDGMVAESGVGTSWLEKNGTGIYPPPSIYAALGCYLLDGVDIQSKHALMFYTLLDLQDMNPESQFPMELKRFPVIFGMNKGTVKLIKAFWYLDRKDSENAIKNLLHPAVRISDILHWQHQRIIKSFLYWREPQKALKYILHMEPPQTNVEDMKLHLSVLLACGAITQAYEYQRKKQILGHGQELLNHLFLGCQEMQKLKDVMYLPLNSFESSALVKFLSESEDPKSQESLVIYHLLHCNLFQAAKVNEKLSRMLMNKLSSIYETTIYERTVDRDALVTSLMAAISKPEKCLAEEMKQFTHEVIKMEEMPQLLSACVKGSSVKAKTYSDILKALFNKSFKSPQVGMLTTPTNASSSAYQDLPFLGPPVTPECIKQQVSFRSKSSAMAKRSRLSSSPTEFSSPAKRSKLLDTVPFAASPSMKKISPKNLASDIVSLLQTPPIHRRTSNLKASGSQITPTVTPQSILKKKIESSKKLTLDFHLATTPPMCSDDESSEEAMNVDEKQTKSVENIDVETPSRQIRFDLPDSPEREPSPFPEPATIEQDAHLSKLFTRDTLSDIRTGQGEAKSILNLTREPLRSHRKDLSFSREVHSITSKEVSMEVGPSPKIPIMVSAIYESVPSSTFTSESYAAKSLKTYNVMFSSNDPESKAASSSKCDITRTPSVSVPDRSPHRSSYPSPRPAVETCFDTSVSPVQRTETPKSVLESGLKSSTKSLTCIVTGEDILLTPQEATKGFQVADEVQEEHSDEEMFYSPSTGDANFNEQPFTFAQPTTLFPEIENLQCQDLFKDNSHYIDFIEADFSAVGSSKESNKNIVFAFSEPCNDSVMEGEGSTAVNAASSFMEEDISVSIQKDAEPSRGTFSFSKNDAPAEKLNIETPPGVVTAVETVMKESVEDEMPEKAVGFGFQPSSAMRKAPRKSKTFVFGKNFSTPAPQTKLQDECSKESKDVISFTFKTPLPSKSTSRSSVAFNIPNPIEEDVPEVETEMPESVFQDGKAVENVDVEIKEKVSREEDISVFETRSTTKRMPRKSKTFVFVKNVSTPGIEIKSQEIAIQEEEKDKVSDNFVFKTPLPVSKTSRPSVTFGVPSQAQDKVDSQLTSAVETPMGVYKASRDNRRVSKHKFTFTKTESSETDGKEDVRTPQNLTDAGVESSAFSIQSRTKSRPSRKTFVFTKGTTASESLSTQSSESHLQGALKQNSKSQSKDELEFAPAETYEEFYGSLKKKSSDDGTYQTDGEIILSSPTESTKILPRILVETKNTKSKKKNPTREKVTKAVGTTPSLMKKNKGKVSQRIEFSFAEPTSPATPEILEALAKSPEEAPLPSFLFSPPLTRGRYKKKKMNETMESSFGSEASFVRPKTPPPVDPILEGIIAEKNLRTKKTTKSTTKKRTSRKPKSQSQLDISDTSFISNASLSESFSNSPSKRNSSTRDVSMHSMVLRQTKAKPKPDSLF